MAIPARSRGAGAGQHDRISGGETSGRICFFHNDPGQNQRLLAVDAILVLASSPLLRFALQELRALEIGGRARVEENNVLGIA